jgi:predicted peptidase
MVANEHRIYFTGYAMGGYEAIGIVGKAPFSKQAAICFPEAERFRLHHRLLWVRSCRCRSAGKHG